MGAPRFAAALSAFTRRRATLVVASLLGAGSMAAGHADDPKSQDRRPRYEGPAWRAAVEGRAGDTALDASGPGDFPQANMALRSWLPIGEFSADATTGSDCWGYVSASGREYAIMTVSNAISFVEVTDPANVTIVSTFDRPTSIWHDVKTFGTYAYAVSEGGGGVEVYDLSQIDAGTVVAVGTVTEGGELATHNVAIDEVSGTLYRCGGGPNGGLRIYDLTDPAAPAFLANWSLRYVHDAQVRTFTRGTYAGRTIAFCAAGFNGGFVETGLTILDVTDASNIIELSSTTYGSAVFAHQCWLSEDGQRLYLGDEVDEVQLGVPTLTRVFDVSDLSAPVEIGSFGNGRDAVDHNQYIVGDRLFQANYRTGLRVWDLTGDPANPVEIGFFDTFPEEDGFAFNGAWSVYPFLPSGTLVVSDIERGLFVLEFDAPTLQIAPSGVLPGELVPATGASFDVVINEAEGGTLDPASVVLVVREADGVITTVPATPGAGGVFSLSIPGGSCGASFTYHVEATDTEGRSASFPLGAGLSGEAAGFAIPGTYGDNTVVTFADDFEADLGWTAGVPEDTSVTGLWERAEPLGDFPGEPGEDNPLGEGTFCFVTGNSTDEMPFQFVREGFVTLESPSFDGTAGRAPGVRFAWWLVGEPGVSRLEVSISADDGATWSLARTFVSIIPIGAWRTATVRFEDVVEPTSAMRVRFRCFAESITEAAIDDVELIFIECDEAACPTDLDGDGIVGITDLLNVLANWGVCLDCETDFDADGVVGINDLLTVLASWGDCP